MAGYEEAMSCHLGDFAEYAALRRELKDRENDLARAAGAARRAAAVDSLERLKVGDVIALPGGRRAGRAVVLAVDVHPPRPLLLTESGRLRRINAAELTGALEPLGRVRVPKDFRSKDREARRHLAATMRALETPSRARQRSEAADDQLIAQLRREIRAHACHGCDDREEHARWAERYWRLRRETEGLARRVEGRTNTVARTFDRVCELLESLGYLDGDRVTESGRMLANIYSENDLLTAECISAQLWDGLDAADLAACVSVLVYEARDSEAETPRLPGRTSLQTALGETVRLWVRLSEAEQDHRLAFIREPDLGFVLAVHRWASGATLDRVLSESGMTAGDFVRWTKQVADLLGQVEDAAPAELGRTARAAREQLLRGVVAYSSVL
jgi:ATP-dependent RNA helicase HelY